MRYTFGIIEKYAHPVIGLVLMASTFAITASFIVNFSGLANIFLFGFFSLFTLFMMFLCITKGTSVLLTDDFIATDFWGLEITRIKWVDVDFVRKQRIRANFDEDWAFSFMSGKRHIVVWGRINNIQSFIEEANRQIVRHHIKVIIDDPVSSSREAADRI